MAPPKRTLLSGDATATPKKTKINQNPTNDSESETTRREGRSKNFKVPNQTASARGTISAKAQGKKVSTQKIITEVLIPMEEQRNSSHERVVFIDNNTLLPKFCLYRKTEKAEPMSHLWADFLIQCQSARDQIGPGVLGSMLSDEEAAAINLKNNTHIFPTLITSKGGLRSKDNLEASTNNAQRNLGGTFTRAGATASDSEILRSRASSLRKKAAALQKQAQAYEETADALEMGSGSLPEETPLAKHGMAFIGESLSLNRKEFNRYIVDHEEHLTVTAEKLRSEMATLAAYVHRAEKRLRDQIQLKVAADLKLCRDIKKFGHFEVQAWQMGALPTESHICWCDSCTGRVEHEGDMSGRARLRFPQDPLLPQSREDALPDIKVEEDSDDEGRGIVAASTNAVQAANADSATATDSVNSSNTEMEDIIASVDDNNAEEEDLAELDGSVAATTSATPNNTAINDFINDSSNAGPSDPFTH